MSVLCFPRAFCLLFFFFFSIACLVFESVCENQAPLAEQFLLPWRHAAYLWQSQDMHDRSQGSASWTGCHCLWVVWITMEMKRITSHVCIMPGNLWSTFTHTSSLPRGSPMRKLRFLGLSRRWENGGVTQWRLSRSYASVPANISQLLSVQIGSILCSHKAINSN